MEDLVPVERIVKRIFFLRGHKVMLSQDLAELYDVEPRALVQAVKRNIKRFPIDFMFQLTWEEVVRLQSEQRFIYKPEFGVSRSQSVILKRGKNIKYLPYAFTEHGVAMLSSVLRSETAIQVNIAIMRAFATLRDILANHKELAKRLDDLEKKYDLQFKIVFDTIRELMTPPDKPERRIGFRQNKT